MKFKPVFIILFAITLIVSCGVNRDIPENPYIDSTLSEAQQKMLDSILGNALDLEALYTIAGKIKPMSTVASFRFPVANSDSTKSTTAEVLDLSEKGVHLTKIASLQHLINSIDFPDLKFVLAPYKSASRGFRHIDLYVIRISLLDSLLSARASFFGQFGLVPGAEPAMVLAATENAGRYERLRAYGYLFGYPDYAVDFFVQASVEQDKTKKLPERNFFQIPAYARQKGTFVYAYPTTHTPDQTDSTLYYRAKEVLDNYSGIRNQYLYPDSTLQAGRLIMDLHKQSKKQGK